MSVAIATFNAAAYLETAVRSALAQSLAAIEVIIVDDCSTDSTLAIASRLRAEDCRVRIDALARNTGPAAARNRALTLARGRWLAVLDADDVLAPGRLASLAAVGERVGADIVADNLVVFGDACAPSLHLDPGSPAGWLTLVDYLDQTVIYGSGANLGYLKPLFRVERLRALGTRYDERLRIAEDDDFVVRALLFGMRYWLEPTAGYGYRRHAASTSHRLTPANAQAMLAAGERHLLAGAAQPASVRAALARRHAGLRRAQAFAGFINALKQRRPGAAFAIALADPALVGLIHLPVAAAFGRLRPAWLPRPSLPPEPAAVAALAALRPAQALP